MSTTDPKEDEAPAGSGVGGRKAAWLDVTARAVGGNTTEVVASTPGRDRMGDVVEQDWRLEAYRRNPVVLVDHDYRAESVVGRAARMEVHAGKLHAEIEWAGSARAQRVRELVDTGFLKSVSVGFLPGKVSPLTDKTGKYLGSRYAENELLEISFVPVPANAAALVVCGLDERRHQLQTEDEPAGDPPVEDLPMSDTNNERLAERIASLEEWNKGLEDKLTRMNPVGVPDREEQAERLGLWMKGVLAVARGTRTLDSVYSEIDLPYQTKAALNENTTTQGAFLVPQEFLREILQIPSVAGVVRQAGARIVNMESKTKVVPVLNADVAVGIVAEGAAISESEPTFLQATLTAMKTTAYAKASLEVLADSAIALGDWLLEQFGRQIFRKEDSEILQGTTLCTGLATASGVGEVTGGTLSNLDWFASALYGTLPSPAERNAVWIMKPAVWAKVCQIKATSGGAAPVVNPTATAETSLSLFGKRVLLTDVITGTTNSSVYLGDFRMGCLLGDRGGLEMLVNPYSYFDTGQVALRVHKRTGAAITLPAAFVKLTGMIH